MHPDRRKWNRKYRQGSGPKRPATIVRDHWRRASRGLALDIAAGNGRNALYLAQQGFLVEALDISDQGLRQFAGTHPRIRAACVDLEIYFPPKSRYSLVINIKYLSRRLFPYIQEALIPGGVLIFETYLQGENRPRRESFCEDHLLRANELLRAFLNLQILFYRETQSAADPEPYPLASLVAVRR